MPTNRKGSILSSIKKSLSPKKSKPKKDSKTKHRRHRDEESSSSSSSLSSVDDDESSYSSLSSGSGSSSFSSFSSSSSELERYSRSRKSKDYGRHSRGGRDRDRRRRRRHSRRRDYDERKLSLSYGYSTPQKSHHRNAANDNDAAQMVDLLMRILPHYGRGDGHSDAVVVDTLHRLPPHVMETRDMEGNTLLMLACQAGAYDLLPVLLSKGCNVNTINAVGASCLHFACFTDTFSPDAAMALLRHGAVAEVVEREFGCTPLHWAAFGGHVELCTALCRRNAIPTTVDKNGCDPIHYAQQNGHTGCAALLTSFSKENVVVPSTFADTASNTPPPTWVRCLDHNGSSFYNNSNTGESLWGDEYREKISEDNSGNNANAAYPPPPPKKSNAPMSPSGTVTSAVSALTSIAEDQIENNDTTKMSDNNQLDIAEDIIETLSIEDDEPTQINKEGKKEDNQVANKNPRSDVKNDTSLERNQSFEARLSSLHTKMEAQLNARLQHLEDKINNQQSHETSMSVKVDDDAFEMNGKVAEMTSTIIQLQTDQGKKNLEILSLKQQIVKLETKQISQEKSSLDACVGDGDVDGDDDDAGVSDELLQATTEKHEQELLVVQTEVEQLKNKVDEATRAATLSKQQYEQCQRDLQVAESSRSSMQAALLEAQKDKGDDDSAALVKSLQEQLRQEEQIVSQMKQQVQSLEEKGVEENDKHHQEVEQLQSNTKSLTKELEMTNQSITVLRNRHNDKLLQCQEELTGVRTELQGMQGQLREAKLNKMEALLARDEAVNSMEVAQDKARSAQAKLKEMTNFINQTETLKKSNDQLHISLQEETDKRKLLHNTLEDIKGRIRVYVRVRPLSDSEVKANYQNVMTKEDDRTCVMASDTATASDVRDWEFDKIFAGNNADGNTQEAVFKDTSLLITSAIDGFNVCIFAYGQTGSGKTYTMLGSGDANNEEHQGLAPRVAFELFRKITEKESTHHIEVSTSMMELYTDKLRDLLKDEDDESPLGDLKIRLAEHTSSGLVEVDGAKVERVSNATELLDVFGRASLARASSSTKMNADSSRSHMIATIVLSLRNRRTGKIVRGKLTLVDLAGSERVGKSGATGQQLKEAQSINKSLSALGDVIGALTSGGRQHIPYRNHPLTMLMSDSIGGNAKTLMFVCCSPADYNRRETAQSLDFAKRCRNVTNNASKGGNGNGSAQIKALRAELSKIKREKTGNGASKHLPKMRSIPSTRGVRC